MKSWLWPNTWAPILLSKLFGHKSTGGLGLLDFSEHSYRLFSKWIFETLNSTSVELSWQNAARVNFCKALGVNNTSYPTSLQKYFYEHPNARGPQSLPEFWRNVLKVIRKLDWKIIINRIDSSWGRRITYAISHLGSNITNAKTKKPILPVITPEFFKLVPFHLPYKNKDIWSACHHPLLHPNISSNV